MPSENIRTLAFHLSETDYINAGRFWLRHTISGRRVRWQRIGIFEIALVVIAMLFAAVGHDWRLGVAALISCQVGLIIAILLTWRKPNVRMNFTEEQRKVFSRPITIVINNQGFTVENEFFRMWRSWQHLNRVAWDDSNLYIFVSPKLVCPHHSRAIARSSFKFGCVSVKIHP